jgi:hypothetical protein
MVSTTHVESSFGFRFSIYPKKDSLPVVLNLGVIIGLTTARETMRQIEETEKNIMNGTISGILDPDYHSSRFHYNFTRNRQKLFFEKFDDQIVFVMAGYDSRNWKKILKEQERFIEKQIALAKKRLKPA